MPLFVAYEMTDGRSMAAIGLVASVVVNSGPYQPASYSTYSRPRATAKSTPARPAAVLSSQRKTLPGLIHEVSARALGGARLRISSALSTSSAWVEPTTIARHGVAKGVVTVLVGSTGPVPRAVCSIRKADRAPGRPSGAPSIRRGQPSGGGSQTQRARRSRAASQTQAMSPSGRVAVSGRSVRGPLSVVEVPETGMEPGATGR